MNKKFVLFIKFKDFFCIVAVVVVVIVIVEFLIRNHL